MKTKDFNDNNFCFVCGTGNPDGLHLSFDHDPEADAVVSNAEFPRRFQGWHGVLHGGIVSTVLDEVMIKAAHHKGFKCVTAELKVKYKKPVLTETEYRLNGRVKESRGKIVLTEGAVTDADGTVLASAEGKLFIL